jgi:hypothetical protein
MASRALRVDPRTEVKNKVMERPRVVDESSIRARAFELWKDRGCPEGSDQQDWFNAEQELIRRTAE